MTSTPRSNNRSIVFSFILLTFLSSLKLTQSDSQKCADCRCMPSSIKCVNTSLPISNVTEVPTTTSISTTVVEEIIISTTIQSKDNKNQPNSQTHNVSMTSMNVSQNVNSSEVSNDNNLSVESELVDLSNRNLTSLKGFYRTWQLIKVQLLNLSANHFAVLVDGGFEGLTSLKCLDLAENNVSLIQGKAFTGLVALQHLNLSRNSLKSLQDETFKELLSLQQLDLSFNDLTNIAPGSLELSSLTRLLLGGNTNLGNGESPLFIATGKRLQTMDASRISLGQVPSALTHSIRTLHLAENRIKIVSCGEMDSYPLLQLLDFTGNEIFDIEEDALGRLEMLTILYLTNNRLVKIPQSLPERLKVLHLENNNIEALRAADLEGMNQLEVLLLNDNRIVLVADGAFGQMASLVTLDLSTNPIRELPAGILAGPSRLRVLRLGQLNVSMSAVKETAFPLPSTEYLITLDLSGSPTVAKQWLGDTAALAAARELQELDLSACAIEHLPPDILHYLPQLRSLHLRDNILNCSGLEWLAEWMRRQEVEEYREVYCQSPGELWGTLLVDLQSLQGTNIDEEADATHPFHGETATTASKQLDLKLKGKDQMVNPLVMNILRQDPKVTTPVTSYYSMKEGNKDGDAAQVARDVEKKANRILNAAGKRPAVPNEVLDATIKSITWPKAIKSVTIANTNSPLPSSKSSSSNGIRTESTPSTIISNLFMKNSSSHKALKEDENDIEMEAKGKEIKSAEIQEKPKSNSANTNSKRIKSLSLIENKQSSDGMENHTVQSEASMYSTMIENQRQHHPGMYLLIIGIMGATLVLITLTTRMSRRSQNDLQELRAYQQDQGELIEVSSLPSVTELW